MAFAFKYDKMKIDEIICNAYIINFSMEDVNYLWYHMYMHYKEIIN